MPDDDSSELTRADFIVQYVNDLARGEIRGLDEYYQRYPGFEDVIASEWRRLEEARLAGAIAPTPAESDSTETTPGPPRPPPDSTRVTSLGRYRIERELGRGVQGTVFQAWDTSVGRRVALKVLKAAWSGSSAMVRRFELESQALARLDHPGIATVHDAGSIQGLPYFAMRHVEGRTLADEIADRREHPVEIGRAEILRYVALVEKAALALHAAHEAGLVHRDVKPSNLMVKPDGEPVLLDFGLALFREAESSLTATGDILGTPAFMAPEQLAGEKGRVDRRSDVFGLAATLHEALTRSVAGWGRARPRAAPFRARPLARRINPAVPRELDAVLSAALDPDPDRRYASSAAFADDLARVRRGQPVAVRPPGALRGLVTWCRRAPALAALVLIVPIALCAGLVALALKNREIEQAAGELAARGAEADAAAGLAKARFAEFRRLDDLRRIQDLEDRERDLWPPHPEKEAAMRRWLEDAREVAGRLPEHRIALMALRRRGRAVPRREPGEPATDQLIDHRRSFEAAEAELRSLPAESERREYLQWIVREAPARIAALENELDLLPRYRFDRVEDQWVHDNLALLVTRLEAPSAASTHSGTIASVEHRLELARSLATTTLTEAADAWRAAIAEIADPAASPAYGGLRITPILGLVPIGRDPKSRLFEFAHVLSGTPPARNADGALVMTPESAIVLVLIPGGTCRMGASIPSNEDERPIDHVDPMALEKEGPVHEVVLDPFLISKYEMTQAQWVHATGKNPSYYVPTRPWKNGYRPTLTHPVEDVTFEECDDVLHRLGLLLPTEAQWECAARAGTTTPWWHGANLESFLHDDNLADRRFVEETGAKLAHDPGRDDSWAGTAPVGTFPANPFGLHDVVGNVAEWCGDEFDFYSAPALPGDGLRCAIGLGSRVLRGGAFASQAEFARSSQRSGNHPTERSSAIGVRPALPVRGS